METKLIPENLGFKELIDDMIACEQTKGMPVLQHGQLVNKYYKDLINHLRTGSPLKYEWKLSDWMDQYSYEIISNVLDDDTMMRYQTYHDCGKPYVRCLDENGRPHFPNHAEASYQVWKELFKNDDTVAELIKNDMQIHTIKNEELSEFCKSPLAISLLITGLCEIHANASMFGGIDSTSFKIKWKQIDRRGKHIVSNVAVH